MSFDLYLYSPDPPFPPADAVESHLLESSEVSPLFRGEGGEFDLVYENQTTGVYADFSYSRGDSVDGPDRPHVAVRINLVRPAFFAHELMPLVTRLSDQFDLAVFDPQTGAEEVERTDELIVSWKRSNAKAVRDLRARSEAFEGRYMPEQKAMAWWRYMYRKEALQEQVGEDVFAPSLLNLETPEDALVTGMVWSDGIPQLFPPCDLVALQGERPPSLELADATEEVALVDYEDLMAQLDAHLEPHRDPTAKKLPLLSRSGLQELAKDDLEPLSPFAYALGDLTRVGSDGFHTVDPD